MPPLGALTTTWLPAAGAAALACVGAEIVVDDADSALAPLCCANVIGRSKTDNRCKISYERARDQHAAARRARDSAARRRCAATQLLFDAEVGGARHWRQRRRVDVARRAADEVRQRVDKGRIDDYAIAEVVALRGTETSKATTSSERDKKN